MSYLPVVDAVPPETIFLAVVVPFTDNVPFSVVAAFVCAVPTVTAPFNVDVPATDKFPPLVEIFPETASEVIVLNPFVWL